MNEHQAIEAVIKATQEIDKAKFLVAPDGWPDQIGMALIDAVYSIQAKYFAVDPAKGVLNRARAFRDKYSEVTNNLELLRTLGEGTIREVMGNGKSNGRYKSVCVIEATENLLSLDPPIKTASQLDPLDPATKRAYTSVRGLGWITYEYFTMLLGKPGVKADTMICRFINEALMKEGLNPVDSHRARHLVEMAHKEVYPHIRLNHFDHAIWLHQRDLPSFPMK